MQKLIIMFMVYYTVEEYERSWEQNEELGLNDMDTSAADAAYNSTESASWYLQIAYTDGPEILKFTFPMLVFVPFFFVTCSLRSLVKAFCICLCSIYVFLFVDVFRFS